MNLIESKTYLNLAKAYAGETQAHVRYKFIAYGARQEGYECLANLIDDLVRNEFNHARMFYTMIQSGSSKEIKNIDICSGYPFKEKWNLLDNLKLAADDEHVEYTKVYPEYKKIAEEEGFADAAALFERIICVEKCHHKLFMDLYEQMKSGTLYKKPKAVKWKCHGCGHEETTKEAWKKCPLCMAPQGMVMIKINDGA